MSILNHLYGQVRGDPFPTSCYVVRADGLFMVARNLDPGFKDYLVYIALCPIMVNKKCTKHTVWGPIIRKNCGVVRTGGHLMVARNLDTVSKHHLVYINLIFHNGKSETRKAKFGVPLLPQTAASLGEWSFYGSQYPVVSVPPVMGSWVQGLFGEYSSFTPIMENQKFAYDQFRGTPVPINGPVVRANGDFILVRSLFYPYQQL